MEHEKTTAYIDARSTATLVRLLVTGAGVLLPSVSMLAAAVYYGSRVTSAMEQIPELSRSVIELRIEQTAIRTDLRTLTTAATAIDGLRSDVFMLRERVQRLEDATEKRRPAPRR